MHHSIQKIIQSHRKELTKLALDIHQNPELGFEEKNACAWQVQLLRKWGFKVQTPFAGLPTAYKAVIGKGKPVLCFMAEYDALPGLGHACGHNLICTCALGAAKALATVLKAEKMPGTVIVMGTPGEEGKGGKVLMIRKKALAGIDAAILAHPNDRTQMDVGFLAISRYDASFYGQSAHAAGDPELGRNALDAVMLLFHATNAWRQHLPDTCRLHGIVTEGGKAPNIVPDYAKCMFYLRAEKNPVLKQMERRFADIARGAALMTGTKEKVEQGDVPYQSSIFNRTFNQEYFDIAQKIGLHPVVLEKPSRGSSDFGDVSQIVPGAHVYFGIAPQKIAGHSPEFRDAAKSKFGIDQMFRATQAVAMVGFRYFADRKFRENVLADFRKQKAG